MASNVDDQESMFVGYVQNVEDVDDLSNNVRSCQQEFVTQVLENRPSKSRQREDGSSESLSKDDIDRGSSNKQSSEIDYSKSGYISEQQFNTFMQSYDSNMNFIRQSLQSLNDSYSEERYDYGCDSQYDYYDEYDYEYDEPELNLHSSSGNIQKRKSATFLPSPIPKVSRLSSEATRGPILQQCAIPSATAPSTCAPALDTDNNSKDACATSDNACAVNVINDKASAGNVNKDGRAQASSVKEDNFDGSQLLNDTLNDFSNDEKVGKDVSDNLAKFVNNMLTSQMAINKRNDLFDKYPRPGNCQLKFPTVNDVIYEQCIGGYGRSNDVKLHSIQKLILKGLTPIVTFTNDVLSGKDMPEKKELSQVLLDAVALLASSSYSLSQYRRLNLKHYLKQEYQSLCTPKTKLTDQLFGDDVVNNIKSLSEGKKMASMVSANSGYSQGASSYDQNFGHAQYDRGFGRGRGFPRGRAIRRRRGGRFLGRHSRGDADSSPRETGSRQGQ